MVNKKQERLHRVNPLEGSTVLKAKLNIPRAQPPLVPRPRLMEELNQGVRGKLILVRAPAGFGKTTLVVEWLKEKGLPVGWVSLEVGDNDPLQFWKYVIAALDKVLPGIFQGIMPALHSMSPLSLEALVTILIEELYLYPGDYILVLDDYHLIDNHSLQESFLFFINHMPENMHVVLLSREEPALNLTRLRVRGEVKEIRGEDLRFNREEVFTFCQQRQMQRDDVYIDYLDKKVEGWVAGLHMAVLSREQEKDCASFFKNFRGDNLYVAAYLAEEVFNGWEEEIQEFLLVTSILERQIADLCDAITGRTNSREILERLAETNAFIITLDWGRGWYRYHNLFSQFLRYLLHKKGTYRLSLLHREAGSWFEDHGLIQEAISHYIQGENYERALSLLEEEAPRMLKNMEFNRLLNWLKFLPRELVEKSPVLCLAFAWGTSLMEDLEEAERWVKRAGMGIEEEKDREIQQLLLGEKIMVQAYVAHRRKDYCRAWELCTRILNYFTHQKRIFDNSFAFNGGEGSLLGGVTGYYNQLKELAHRPFDAGVNGSLKKIGAPAGYIYVITGELLYEWNQLERALPVLLEGLSEAQEEASLGVLIPGLICLAKIKRAWGKPGEALEVVEKGCQRIRETRHKQWVPHLNAFKVQLLLSRGDKEESSLWMEKSRLSIYDRLLAHRELEYLTLARVLMDRGMYKETMVFLARLHLLMEREQRHHGMIEVFNLQSLAYFNQGETTRAMEALEKSLLLAEPLGYLRKFIDEGRPMLELLRKYSAWQKKNSNSKQAVTPCFVKKLVRLTREGVIMGWGGEMPEESLSGSGENLTKREQEVLRFLAQDLTNQEIANRLAIALPTVKSHISSIFSKLGVNSRMKAAEKARELKLI